VLALDTNADRPRGPGSGAAITPRPALAFDPHQAERTLGDHFKVATMAGFGFEEFDASLCAAAAVLDYLKETQRTERQDDEVPEGQSKTGLHHITAIVPRHTDGCVLIDQATLRALEVDRSLASGSREGTLLGSIDMTTGPMGGRRLRQWLLFPLCSVEEIRARQEAIAELAGALRIADCGSRVGDHGGGMGGSANENGPSGITGPAQPDSKPQPPDLEHQSSIVNRQSGGLLGRVREQLGRTGDLERITARLGIGRASPRDMVGLGRALGCCGELAGALRIVDCGLRMGDGGGGSGGLGDEQRQDVKHQSSIVNRRPSILLAGLADALAGHDDLAEFLDQALQEDAPAVVRDGGFIADGYDEELDRLRHVGRAGHEWLAEFQARESKRTGIPTLKVGYNSVFGYYLEVTHQHSAKVPAEYVRKQTVRNAERYITDDLKRHESEVLGAAERAKQRELKLFDQIRERAAEELSRLTAAADALATLDTLAGLAELSRRRNYCRPEILDCGSTIEPGEMPATNQERPDVEGQSSIVNRQSSIVLEVVDGRHPVLDVTLAERFVPNDCRLADDGDRMLLITGPNMAGKSTYIRQVALLVLLAQTGSWVPAKSMRFTPVDRVFARVGAGDELVRGKSTFMVEMLETARILHTATARSLVILDELGRGTSTYDGLALAWAITEHLAQRIGCRTLFATHYHELTELAEQLDGVSNFNVTVREELRPSAAGRDVVFLHRIVPGATDRSYGVHVAAMAGLPASVLKRGEAILVELEGGFAGRSRSTDLAALPGQDPGQLPLFPGPEPMPDWWGPLVDALGEIDVDRTAPLEALKLLQRLQRIARGE
jgi:DNA mismatch repair protein MutS